MIMQTKEEQDVLDAFILSLGNNLKERTKIEYMKAFKKMRDDMGGIRPLTDNDVNSWLSKRAGSINRAMIKNWIEFARFDVRIPKNRGTKARKEVVTIPQDEQAKIIQYAYDHSDNIGYPIAIALALECALRRQEVVGVCKSDFNRSRWREDLLRDSNSPCELLVRGKGSKERIVIVSKALMTTILDYMETRQDEKLFGFSDGQFYKKFNETCKALGYVKLDGKPKYHPHSMRHTQGTQWHEQGVDIIEIKERLGHSSIATTQLYINPDREKMLRRWKQEKK